MRLRVATNIGVLVDTQNIPDAHVDITPFPKSDQPDKLDFCLPQVSSSETRRVTIVVPINEKFAHLYLLCPIGLVGWVV